mmetsp:Transcript_19110/g.26279  ORF Transcript_19110/g.26279 Transcript_19110/m.26279 type:complete len:251 (+) Transcript_19110:741-1493(+)
MLVGDDAVQVSVRCRHHDAVWIVHEAANLDGLEILRIADHVECSHDAHNEVVAQLGLPSHKHLPGVLVYVLHHLQSHLLAMVPVIDGQVQDTSARDVNGRLHRRDFVALAEVRALLDYALACLARDVHSYATLAVDGVGQLKANGGVLFNHFLNEPHIAVLLNQQQPHIAVMFRWNRSLCFRIERKKVANQLQEKILLDIVFQSHLEGILTITIYSVHEVGFALDGFFQFLYAAIVHESLMDREAVILQR